MFPVYTLPIVIYHHFGRSCSSVPEWPKLIYLVSIRDFSSHCLRQHKQQSLIPQRRTGACSSLSNLIFPNCFQFYVTPMIYRVYLVYLVVVAYSFRCTALCKITFIHRNAVSKEYNHRLIVFYPEIITSKELLWSIQKLLREK